MAASGATRCSFCLVEEESVAKEKALAVWDATRCSNSSLKRDLAKRIIIPNKECYGCKKELADGDMQYYCSTCNFVFQNIYASRSRSGIRNENEYKVNKKKKFGDVCLDERTYV